MQKQIESGRRLAVARKQVRHAVEDSSVARKQDGGAGFTADNADKRLGSWNLIREIRVIRG